MNPAHRLPAVLLLAILTACVGTATGADSPTAYLRLVENGAGEPAALEAATARFEGRGGVTVDLVSAVHVAERDWYRSIDDRLAGYDVVLYELVGDPEAVTAPQPDAALSLVGLLQGGMQEALGLAFQLDEIDYRRANMVHADLTQEEFRNSMRERDESMFQLVLRAWALGHTEQGRRAAIRQQNDLLAALFAEDRQLALRRLAARQLADDELMRRLLATREGSTLIEVRNVRALEELERQLQAGARSIAIFYGAGHMADLAARLEADHGFAFRSVEWTPAWNLRERKAGD